MVDALRCTDPQLSETGLTAWCGPLRLTLRCALRDAPVIAQGMPGAVSVRLVLREGEPPALYAFPQDTRRRLFDALCSVSGIGPGTALAVLEAGTDQDLLRAVADEDARLFTAVPGLGPKRAAACMAAIADYCAGILPPGSPNRRRTRR